MSLSLWESRAQNSSRQNIIHDMAMHIGQWTVDAIFPPSQPSVVNAQQVQYRGMEVVAVSFSLGRLVAPVITLAVSRSGSLIIVSNRTFRRTYCESEDLTPTPPVQSAGVVAAYWRPRSFATGGSGFVTPEHVPAWRPRDCSAGRHRLQG